MPMHTVSWVLNLPFGTLSSWNQGFDEEMRPYRETDGRGKAVKVTVEIVRKVVDKAREQTSRNKRIRIKEFTRTVNRDLKEKLSRKTIEEILTANDLWKADTRRRRPVFYRNLSQRIPNGLLSLDGSEFEVWLNEEVIKMIVELGVDVGSFCHTGFGIHESETSEAVLDVLEQHCARYGIPLGVVFDHGSANLSDEVRQYLEAHHIEIVPAGPANPKGNGTDEGAFSQMKKVIGVIRLDTSSPVALVKSVLNTIISVYVNLRNRMPLHKNGRVPLAQMEAPAPEAQQEEERERLKKHKASRTAPDPNQEKPDRLHWLIQHHQLTPEPLELKRAEFCIRSRDLEAILKAVNRDERRRNLSYFFGILNNVQKEMDDSRHQEYCRQRYNYEVMLENNRQAEEQKKNETPTIEGIVSLASGALPSPFASLKRMAMARCKGAVEKLLQTVRYVGPIKKKILTAIGARDDLDLAQKEQVWGLIEPLLNQKPQMESVTPQP